MAHMILTDTRSASKREMWSERGRDGLRERKKTERQSESESESEG